MTTATVKAPPTTGPSPVTHGVCGTCWPDPTAPLARGLCGQPANPTPPDHVCGYQGIGCGCTPCVVCVQLDVAPCSVCLTGVVRALAEDEGLTFAQVLAVAMTVGPMFTAAALSDRAQRGAAMQAGA